MLKIAVILLTLFNCIAGEVNTANALLPLARTDVSLSLSNSSMLMERIIADPKLFVSQIASADPGVIRNVIGMLQLLIQTGTTAVTKFERDVTEAKADEDAKIKIHDDLSSLVENLTKTEENLVAEKLIVTATIVTKTEEKRVAGLDKTAAVAHHTSMVSERDANVPDLTTDNTALRSVISILEGLLPAPTAAPVILFTPAVSLDFRSGYDSDLKRWNSLGSDEHFMDMEGVELVDGGFHFNNHVATYPFDISASVRPHLSLEIRFKIVSHMNMGWIIGHDNGGYDRAINLFDARFGGIAAAIGGTYSSTLGYPNINEWYHVIVTFTNGDSNSAVYVHEEDGSTKVQQITPHNAAGESSFSVGGLVNYGGHSVNAIVSTVRVYDRFLSAAEVNIIFSQYE